MSVIHQKVFALKGLMPSMIYGRYFFQEALGISKKEFYGFANLQHPARN